MISVKNVVVILLFVGLLFFFCGKSENTPFTVTGTVYLNNQPKANVEVEFGVKSAGNYAPSPWKENIKKTSSDGSFSFSTTDYGYQCRLRVKNPITGDWEIGNGEKGYLYYENGKGKTKSGGKWTHDFYLTGMDKPTQK
ncbi:hypothetical protein DRQ09_04020 [candidate division KSB1 bacterium]|nr:MAG: hypothetical protein DRQ09_04020 [candidate division KSB1 bacterium]